MNEDEDLFAPLELRNLQELAEKNGIRIPRARHFTMMEDGWTYDKEHIENYSRAAALHVVRDWCCSRFFADPFVEFSDRTNRLIKKYAGEHMDRIRWELIHGKKRRRLKYAIKKAKKNVYEAFSVWNKYAGRADVMHIDARIGGDNWYDYGGAEIEQQPWFLEKVDYYFDNTCCDIYVKLEVLRA